jgi:hypothetical protein
MRVQWAGNVYHYLHGPVGIPLYARFGGSLEGLMAPW